MKILLSGLCTKNRPQLSLSTWKFGSLTSSQRRFISHKDYHMFFASGESVSSRVICRFNSARVASFDSISIRLTHISISRSGLLRRQQSLSSWRVTGSHASPLLGFSPLDDCNGKGGVGGYTVICDIRSEIPQKATTHVKNMVLECTQTSCR